MSSDDAVHHLNSLVSRLQCLKRKLLRVAQLQYSVRLLFKFGLRKHQCMPLFASSFSDNLTYIYVTSGTRRNDGRITCPSTGLTCNYTELGLRHTFHEYLFSLDCPSP
ncbi:hypothetical protein H5410_020179 [Solanum commersonii]|uniref:Uncharacterized protein n=1 Tax=Solanum commersonii TaxID=4109 RepID=A0A9J5Z8B7_SOLCO|nr:hypothetical protein H5410_020179 [Solanum commersonii]